ncbi:MAG TPA: AAA family ATPase [Steroidobacteraceae bacterium]|nr:AAA family ATPase [Steroidobacteraceae bacterium]
MYKKFYGLRANPFALTPDPAYLYLGRSHRFALTLLDYALQQGSGFALVSGEVGGGKTTIIRYLLGRAPIGLRIGLLTNVYGAMGALLPWLLQSLGVKPERTGASDLYAAFVAYLTREHAAGHRVVLIIDEAQNLSAEALEELRLLSNVNSSQALLLQTILVGQPELRTTLRERRMRQLAQRVAIDYHITALQPSETHAYIRHRLTVAGGRPDLFTPEAHVLVHSQSRGVPRIINQICDTALVYGFGEQVQTIGPKIIEQVSRDRGESGLLPLGMRALPGGEPVVAN